jgi:hypothetical protein
MQVIDLILGLAEYQVYGVVLGKTGITGESYIRMRKGSAPRPAPSWFINLLNTVVRNR